MPASKTYNRYAMQCLDEARKTFNQKQKAFLVEMAHEWQRLAEQRQSLSAVVGPLLQIWFQTKETSVIGVSPTNISARDATKGPLPCKRRWPLRGWRL